MQAIRRVTEGDCRVPLSLSGWVAQLALGWELHPLELSHDGPDPGIQVAPDDHQWTAEPPVRGVMQPGPTLA